MELPKRKTIRLQEYDYSSNGAYFITICTHEKRCILWEDGCHVPLCKIENMYERGDFVELPKRKTIRLQEYDYSSNGAYFVTICTHDRKQILGDISCRGGALLHPIGLICENQIGELENRYNIKIDKYVIMPNHMHMIIVIDGERAEQSPAPTISDMICAFKSITTKLANRNDNVTGRKIWQKSFHEHIIRTQKSYEEIWQYIDTNPLKWELDKYYNTAL